MLKEGEVRPITSIGDNSTSRWAMCHGWLTAHDGAAYNHAGLDITVGEIARAMSDLSRRSVVAG